MSHPEAAPPPHARLVELSMSVLRAGFRLERVVPTNSPVSVVEAVPDASD